MKLVLVAAVVVLVLFVGGSTRSQRNMSGSQLPDSWTVCTTDSECAYLPHPCCPGWTAGAFGQEIVKNKPIDTAVCQPKPAECISAQPAIPSGKVIRAVCRKNRCEIELVDNNSSKPVRMEIP